MPEFYTFRPECHATWLLLMVSGESEAFMKAAHPSSNRSRKVRPRTRDHLKSDRDAMAGGNPAAQRDQYGSRHNADDVKAAQRQHGRPRGRQDLAFRESAQDVQPDRGRANKMPGGRGAKPSGSAGT
jgi:hypothetical protein